MSMKASVVVIRVLISVCLSLCWCFLFRLPWDSATNCGNKGERLLLFFLVSFEVFSQYRLCANDTRFCLSPSAKWPQPTVSSLMFTSNLSSLCFSLETILKLIKLILLQRANCAVVSIGECPRFLQWDTNHCEYMVYTISYWSPIDSFVKYLSLFTAPPWKATWAEIWPIPSAISAFNTMPACLR